MKKYSSVEYLGGIPSYAAATTCTLMVSEQGISIRRWGRIRATIRIEDIADVQVVPYFQAFPPATEQKSVIGRAVIGGLLLGPVGAVVGGMSGIGVKPKLTLNQAANAGSFIVFIEAAEVGIRFRCGFIFDALLFKKRAAAKAMEYIQRLRFEVARRAQPNSPPPPTALPPMQPASKRPVSFERGNQ